MIIREGEFHLAPFLFSDEVELVPPNALDAAWPSG